MIINKNWTDTPSESDPEILKTGTRPKTNEYSATRRLVGPFDLGRYSPKILNFIAVTVTEPGAIDWTPARRTIERRC